MAKYMHADDDQFQMVILNFRELFPTDHPIRQLLSIIRGLDLSAFDQNYANSSAKGGRAAFPVDRLLAILIYSLLHGNISMRAITRDMSQRADLLCLSGGLALDHSTISVFRKRHAAAIEHLFTQTVFLGAEAGLIDFDAVCIDSTKIKANANRRDIGTREQLQRRYDHIEEACTKRYRQWQQATDAEEQAVLHKKIERMRTQQEKIERGMAFLQEHSERKRVHLTDPDADWQKGNTGNFIVGYNAHVAVDAATNMIVHQEVVTQQADSTRTLAMIAGVEAVKESADTIAKQTTSDTPTRQADTQPTGQDGNRSVEQAVDHSAPSEVKYILDSGYSCHTNLDALTDTDVYMPDTEFASIMEGKKNPEDRKAAQQGGTAEGGTRTIAVRSGIWL